MFAFIDVGTLGASLQGAAAVVVMEIVDPLTHSFSAFEIGLISASVFMFGVRKAKRDEHGTDETLVRHAGRSGLLHC